MEGRTGIVEGEAASVSAGAEDYTLGVEEEYRIIGPETRALSPSGQAVVRRAQQALGEEHIAPEFRTSQVVAMTPICRTLAEVRAELLRLRRGVIGAAAGEGCQVAAASTHPFSHWEEQPVTPKGRYREIVEREQQLAEEQVVFGFQVHIGLEDRETAVEVINRARMARPDPRPLCRLSLLARQRHRLRQLPHAGLEPASECRPPSPRSPSTTPW